MPDPPSPLPTSAPIHTLSLITTGAIRRGAITVFLSWGDTYMSKYVYFFGGKSAEGNGKMKELLGGKGANLAEMCLIGLPVPAGFTITTEVCNLYYANNKTYPKELKSE